MKNNFCKTKIFIYLFLKYLLRKVKFSLKQVNSIIRNMLFLLKYMKIIWHNIGIELENEEYFNSLLK